MTSIYIVMGGHDHEGSDVLRAFFDNKKAHAFVAQCYAHKADRPRAPSYDHDNPPTFEEPEWIAHHAADDAWRKSAPSGNDYDFYHVRELELEP